MSENDMNRPMGWNDRMVSVTRLELRAARLLANEEAAAWREGLSPSAEAQALRDELEHVLGRRPDVLEPEAGDRLIPLAHDNGVAVITNRPFVNGQYFPMVQGKVLPTWASEFDCDTWAQFSLKWIISNPLVNCAITETSKFRHAVDNLSAGLGRLPNEDQRARMQAFMRSI